MMETANAYWRQFAAWATVLRERYTSDLFFRTSVHIIALQAGLVVIKIVAFWLALQYANREILAFIVGHIEDIVSNAATGSPADVSAAIREIQATTMAYILGAFIAISVFFGAILARFTLKPARDTLRRQKLFIGNVAHELRTPLSSIKTSAEVALLDEHLSPPMRRMLLSNVEELNRMSEIVNNLLSLDTFSRPERMQFSDVDLGPVVRGVVRRHVALASDRGVKVVVKMDAHRVVWGNAAALEQVITNLLKNAIHYTPKGQNGAVTISVRPDYHGLVMMSVADTGIGISQEDLFHIFEPFYRADASRTRTVKHAGSGLGLSIVNEIVRAHHGRISVQSALRRGTVVSIYLPSGAPAGHAKAPSGAKQPANGSAHLSEVSIDFSQGFNHPRP